MRSKPIYHVPGFLNAMGKRVRNEFLVRLNQLEFGFDHAFDHAFDYVFDHASEYAFDYGFE
jgi:hypothetical protein